MGERTVKPRHNSECNHRGHPRRSRRANRSTASGESWLPWAVIITNPGGTEASREEGRRAARGAQHTEFYFSRTPPRPQRMHTAHSRRTAHVHTRQQRSAAAHSHSADTLGRITCHTSKRLLSDRPPGRARWKRAARDQHAKGARLPALHLRALGPACAPRGGGGGEQLGNSSLASQKH
jgi:hypothetical protein